MHERGPRARWARRRFSGATPIGLAAVLPRLWRARRLATRYDDAAELLAQLRDTPARLAPMTPEERVRLYDNMRVGAYLVQPSGDRCLIRSLALFEALRARGEPVTLYLGVDPSGRRHAWLRNADGAAAHTATWTNCPVTGVVATSAPAATEFEMWPRRYRP